MGHGGNLDGLLSDSGANTKKRRFGKRLWLSDDDIQSCLKRFAEEKIRGNASEQQLPKLNNPDVPAGYTYLAQFMTHDMSFNAGALLDPGQSTRIEARTTSLDLDSLYGGGPDANPLLYQIEGRKNNQCIRSKLRIGRTKKFENVSTEDDLPRACLNDIHTNFSCSEKMGHYPKEQICETSKPPKDEESPFPYFEAIVADSRNTDNLILQQFVVLFIKLHNKICDLRSSEKMKPDVFFRSCRNTCTVVYRSVIVNDLLYRLLNREVYEHFFGDGLSLDALSNPLHANKLSNRHDQDKIFSSAAMRLGHAMIQPRYDYNSFFGHEHPKRKAAFLRKLLTFRNFLKKGDTDMPVTDDWIIDWDRFFPPLNPDQKPKDQKFNDFVSGIVFNKSKKIGFDYSATFFDKLFNNDPQKSGPWIGGLAFADLYRNFKNKLPQTSDVLDDAASAFDSAGISIEEDMEAIKQQIDFPEELLEILLVYLIGEAQFLEDGNRMGKLASYIVAAQVARSLTELELSASDKRFINKIGISGMPIWMQEITSWLGVSGYHNSSS
ncbi:MAG: peroxidase family protein [Pseudomonadota bacterium]